MTSFVRDVYHRDFTYYVGGGNHEVGRLYGLWRNGQLLVVQSRTCIDPKFDYEDPKNRLAYREAERLYINELGVIQTLLDNIEFGRSNWAFLVHHEDGTHRLMYRNRFVEISYPIWLPLIEERDITITKWVGLESRDGLWNGQEVDLYMSWNDDWAQLVSMETEGQRKMHELGLSHLAFKALGHVVSDGMVIGLMREVCLGRPLTYGDRSDVYSAVALMQSKGILHRSLRFDTILVTDQGIRFQNMSSILLFPKDQAHLLEQQAESYHWERLEVLFRKMIERDEDFVLLTTRHFLTSALVIPRLPSPLRYVTPDAETFLSAFAVFVEDSEWFHLNHIAAALFPRPKVRRSKASKAHRRSIGTITSPDSRHSCNLSDDPLIVIDSRSKSAHMQQYLTRIRLRQVFHPYSRGTGSKTLLLGPDGN